MQVPARVQSKQGRGPPRFPCCTRIDLLPSGPLQVLQNWWLSVWAHQTQAAGDHLSSDGLHFYLGVYSLIGMAALSSQAIRGVFLLFGMLNASRVLHADLVKNVSAPPDQSTLI